MPVEMVKLGCFLIGVGVGTTVLWVVVQVEKRKELKRLARATATMSELMKGQWIMKEAFTIEEVAVLEREWRNLREGLK